MLSILCDSIGKCVQAFDDCVVHAFHGTTIQRLTFNLERQPKLVRNAAFVLLRVGTNDVCYRTRSPAIIHQLFELLVNQILSIVPNARILISSILPRLRDFDEKTIRFARSTMIWSTIPLDTRSSSGRVGPSWGAGDLVTRCTATDCISPPEASCSLGRCGSLSTSRCKGDVYKLGNWNCTTSFSYIII